MPSMTYKEAKYAAYRAQGLTKYDAALKAGFTPSIANISGRAIETDEIRAEVARLQAELVANTLQAGLIDATEIHEYLTDALRADMRDIRNEDGSFKPQSEWPEIWGRMMEAGDVEVEYTYDRSHDGETADKRGGWDTAGEVKKVKLKFSSRVKLLELAMKHKGVNAMVEQKQGDVNIVVITAEQARKVAGAKKRLARAEKVIDVKAKECDE